MLKFGRYMHLYFIKAYVVGPIVLYRGLIMKAPKLKTAEILNDIHQCKKYIFYKAKYKDID